MKRNAAYYWWEKYVEALKENGKLKNKIKCLQEKVKRLEDDLKKLRAKR